LTKSDFTIRPINQGEIEKVADLLSTGYYYDKFFKWSVESDDARHKVVLDYYKIYLNAVGCVAHVAESPDKGMIGASVWLPHDVDTSIYDEIDKVVGVNAPQFRAVSDRSHDSEPPMEPFYQLVGFGVLREVQGMGVGGALLKYQLDKLDEIGIATYLEASTPYTGGGVYGRFGYQPVGELMVFAETAVLYPLWRPANKHNLSSSFDFDNLDKAKGSITRFGDYDWHVLDVCDDKVLLLSTNVIDLQKYHDVFENVTWSNSTIRKYLNSAFYNTFKLEDQLQIVEAQVCNHSNPWFGTDGGVDTTDKIFLLSIDEVVKYLGDSGQLKNRSNKYYIDDRFNDVRRAIYMDNSPSKWILRTPGNLPYFVANVTIEGKIIVTGDFVNRSSSELFNIGIRPALWVKKYR